MFKYIAGAVGLLFLSSPLYALDATVGTFFRVEHISFRKGKMVLPTEKRKYHNIRILDKNTFLQVGKCQEQPACKLKLEKAVVKVGTVRAASTRPDMWIAEVSFSDKWEITFLVFKNKDGLSVKRPKHFVFLDDGLEKEVTKQIEQVLK